VRVKGVCHAYFAVDLGFGVDLARAEKAVAAESLRQTFKRPRLAPEAAQLRRHSLRLAQSGFPIEVGAWKTDGAVEVVIWEFAAATIDYRIPIDAELGELVALADHLWDHAALVADARQRAKTLLANLGDAVEKPLVGGRVEDYVAFELRLPPGAHPEALWTTDAATTARLLRAEPGPLGQQEIDEALSMRTAYLPDECVLVDWFAAILAGDDMEDERVVLELSIAELLELRHLDEQLDAGIERAYAILNQPRGFWSGLRAPVASLDAVAHAQADAAVLFEGVDNALKLLGDQYLARLYHVVSQRFHLPDWDAAIQRKLGVLDSIHEKLSSRASTRRFELLEVIVILLILTEIMMPLFERLGH
jgi:hypothetical protein